MNRNRSGRLIAAGIFLLAAGLTVAWSNPSLTRGGPTGAGGTASAPAAGSSSNGTCARPPWPMDDFVRRDYNPADTVDLKDAKILNNPPDLASWPVTTTITDLEMGPNGVHVEFSKRNGAGSWPDETVTFGPTGPLQYTLGMALYIDGQWYASAPVQFWRGLDQSGGAPEDFACNWFYDAGRWGPMKTHQPIAGEEVGFFVVAGSVRNVTDNGSQSPVKERSNVFLVRFPGEN